MIALTSSWRWLSDQQLEARFGPGQHEKVREEMVRVDEDFRQKMRELKEEIAKELLAAHDRGQIYAREPLLAAVAIDAGQGSTAYLTANWDLSLEKLLESHRAGPSKVLHLHGDIRHPHDMLLPGERLEELHREKEPNARITGAYRKAMNIFACARRIYIAGLSLSPLDATLGVAIGMGLAGNKQSGEIIVVNKTNEETVRIKRQIRMITPPAWSIRGLLVG